MSSQSTGHRDTGLAHARPVRPGASAGKSVVVVRDRVVDHIGNVGSTSIPRAATSVAIRDVTFAEALNAAICALAPGEVSLLLGGIEAAVVELFDELNAAPLRAGETTVLPRPSAWRDAGDDSSLSIEWAR
jgi:hypothetical protein